ncbi:MAG: hypothetical protein WBW88_07910 [Rhodothermales bacterium]|jgi:hypothetical protein
MRPIFRISFLLLALPVLSNAQETGDAFVQIESNLDGSLILVDSTYVGKVGEGTLIRIDPGEHTLGVAPPEVGSWALSPPETSISARAGDTLTITLDFPYTYRIDSTPFGARVFREDEDRKLGETPLVFSSETALRSALILEKAGYATERIMPGTEVVNRHSVALRQVEPQIAQSDAVEWTPPADGQKWLTYAAVGMITAGGALAVHFKFAADDRYEEYLATADSETKAEVDRLDRLSYVALGGVQVGVGILVYRLAF